MRNNHANNSNSFAEQKLHSMLLELGYPQESIELADGYTGSYMPDLIVYRPGIRHEPLAIFEVKSDRYEYKYTRDRVAEIGAKMRSLGLGCHAYLVIVANDDFRYFDCTIGSEERLLQQIPTYDVLENEARSRAVYIEHLRLENFTLFRDSNFEFGAAAYLNFALFGGLGVQIEPTLIKSNVSFSGTTMTRNQDYEVMTLDIPVMVWLNLDLWKLTIGFGGGVDFSMELNKDAKFADVASDVAARAQAASQDMSTTSFAWIVGADVKFYLTKHLGLVASARYIMDINKKDVPVTVNVAGYEADTGMTYPTIEYGRRFLYGGLGVEFKFF